MTGLAVRRRLVSTSSPGSPLGSGRPLSESMTSAKKWSSKMWMPSCWRHSTPTPGPPRSEGDPEPAGEQPVPVCVLHDVGWRYVRGAVHPLHAFRPEVQVSAGVAGHHGLARRPARHVDPHDLIVRHREEAERVRLA